MARTVTERTWSTGTYLRLAETPNSITTIDGVAVDAASVILVAGGAIGSFAVGWHTVVYDVGAATPPAWAVLAAKAKTKQLWQLRLGPKGDRSGVDYGARAEGLISAHKRGPRP